jgi:hypothetical protein
MLLDFSLLNMSSGFRLERRTHREIFLMLLSRFCRFSGTERREHHDQEKLKEKEQNKCLFHGRSFLYCTTGTF